MLKEYHGALKINHKTGKIKINLSKEYSRKQDLRPISLTFYLD